MAEYVNVKQFCSGPITEFGDIEGLPGKRWKLNKPRETDRYKLQKAFKAHRQRITETAKELEAKAHGMAEEAEARRTAEEERLRADECQMAEWRKIECDRLAPEYEDEAALNEAVEAAVERRIIDSSEEAGRVYLDELDDVDAEEMAVVLDWSLMEPAIRLSVYLTPETDPVTIAKHFDIEWTQHCLALVDEIKTGAAAKKALRGSGPSLPRI